MSNAALFHSGHMLVLARQACERSRSQSSEAMTTIMLAAMSLECSINEIAGIRSARSIRRISRRGPMRAHRGHAVGLPAAATVRTLDRRGIRPVAAPRGAAPAWLHAGCREVPAAPRLVHCHASRPGLCGRSTPYRGFHEDDRHELELRAYQDILARRSDRVATRTRLPQLVFRRDQVRTRALAGLGVVRRVVRALATRRAGVCSLETPSPSAR